MELSKISQNLPNGFHDGYIRSIAIDYPHHRIELVIDALVGSQHSSVRFSTIKLHLIDFVLLSIEPPDSFVPMNKPRGLWIDEVEVREEMKQELKSKGLSAGAEYSWLGLFVYQWNSRIIVCARDAKLEKLDSVNTPAVTE